MPRGVKGTGPYSKYPKQEGEVSNDLAAPLRSTKVTVKKAPAKKAATAKKVLPKQTPTEKFTRVSTGSNGHTQVKVATHVLVEADGSLTFTAEDGKKQKIQLAGPHLLLDLEAKSKAAADTYAHELYASRQ